VIHNADFIDERKFPELANVYKVALGKEMKLWGLGSGFTRPNLDYGAKNFARQIFTCKTSRCTSSKIQINANTMADTKTTY